MARTYTNSLAAVAASFPGSVYEPVQRLNGAQDYTEITETFTVPAVADSEGRYRVELDYAINSNVTPVINCGVTLDLARIPYPSVPAAGQVGVAVSDVPILEFHADRAGETGQITYQPLGSVRTAGWENRIQVEIAAVQEAVGTGDIADSRLSDNVPLLDAATNAFEGNLHVDGQGQYEGLITANSGAVIGTSGTQINKILSGTAAIDFGSIAAGTALELTITVSGAASGNTVMVTPPIGIEAGLIWCGYVSAADTVTIRVGNITGSAIDPASATWRATVVQF